jgi:ABC-type polysaccharide/polyol phosphate transport system ATPase subunit
MDPAVAVRVEDLWIRYRASREVATLKRAFRYRRSTRLVEALRGVTFDVPSGMVYAVVGHNGAGKSTLFRVVAGVLAPSQGRVLVNGRVTPLLSLGVGFNQELSGRENILLGGLAAGLHPEQIAAHFHEIASFADLGDALDYPMRTYSSGMFGRLGFAVAVHLEPEILLIDEALGAGDVRFRAKASEKMMELCTSGGTVLLVSHGLKLVRTIAERALWIDGGRVVAEGLADDIVPEYMEFMQAGVSASSLAAAAAMEAEM